MHFAYEAEDYFKEFPTKSWLELLWDTASQDLIDKYSREQFHITFDHQVTDDRIVDDKIIISKM